MLLMRSASPALSPNINSSLTLYLHTTLLQYVPTGSLSMPSASLTDLLPQDHRIHMSESDFMDITRNGEFCNARGEIGQGEFQAIMRREVPPLLQHACGSVERQHA